MRYIKLLAILAVIFSACSPKLSPDSYWQDKKWVLREINGVPVQLSGTNRDAHLNFSPADKRYTGSGGCNRISGTYEIRNSGRIDFSDPTRTRMACDDIAFEDNFLNLLDRVDRFTVENNRMYLKDNNRVLLVLE